MNSPTTGLEIRGGGDLLGVAESAIVVPLDAIHYPNKVAGYTTVNKSDAKHTFQALSQIALFDFEENNIDVETVPEGVQITLHDPSCNVPIDQGILITRDQDGKVHILAHDHVDTYRLLKFAHRHCTRWIRLDI